MLKKTTVFVTLFAGFCFPDLALNAQVTRKVLFLGNSYTYVNNLPQLLHDVALSAGDTLIFDSYAPGGYQLEDHSTDVNSQAKIMAGGWNYVVMQGQSQEPIVFSSQFNNGGFALYNLIKQNNPCAVVMPYMTWGRKNGDASNCSSFPLTCTYQLMDSTIRSRYIGLTSFLNGELSPVSVVWKHLRQANPGIELYQADESHPSPEGSYAAACCFYTSLFKKDPTFITFNFGLSAANASAIRSAVKTQVFDSLTKWDYKKLPVSSFDYQIGSGLNEVIFHPISQGVRQTYFWDFGDNTSSTAANPTHSFLSNGTYTVSLTTTNCDLQGQHVSTSDTVIQFCAHTPSVYTTNAWLCKYDTLWTQTADSYQWFSNAVALPETNRFLADYGRYNITGFSVLTTINGCSELSQITTQTPEWSGYYFDGIGDPCTGDTVRFAVLNTNGFLPGSEKILWYKNGSLLSSVTNEDTLLITGSGEFECKIVQPGSHCPFDTTSYRVKYDCGDVSIADGEKQLSWTIFPNPASENITITAPAAILAPIQIYSATGNLIKTLPLSGPKTRLNIAFLPAGLYYVRLNSESLGVKFIKQ